MKNDFLEAGKIVNTHGLRGEIKIYPLCDSADFLCQFNRFFIDGQQIEILSSRVHKNQLLAKLSGIDSIDVAQSYIGKIIQIKSTDVELEDGQYFIEDLLGMRVIDADTGKEYGILKNIFSTGANDVYEVVGEKTYLVPKIDDVVLSTDFDQGTIIIRPLKGLFDL